jgi:hypothetical protein
METPDLFYAHPETNVFCASPEDCQFLSSDLEVGHWYYADVTWTVFHGPYHSQQEADTNFQQYIRNVRMCPSCEE